jgi:ABC-2 type transport system permease protein
MAIYDHGYRVFRGQLRPAWSRFLVPARYALRDAFSSKLFLSFFLVCFLWPAACAVIIYLRYNSEALAVLDISVADLLRIDAQSFRDFYMNPQSAIGFFIILVLGPALISPDLRNNGLPLYLARPLTKTDYVLGKLAVLAAVLSAMSWIPGGLLFFFQSYLAGNGWWRQNFRALIGMFIGFWVWILVLSIFSLAVSAWVKWKPLARLLFLGLGAVLAGMGQAFNMIYGTWTGSLLVVNELLGAVWDQLFGLSRGDVPPFAAWLGLLALSAVSVWLLSWRIRAYEVVK